MPNYQYTARDERGNAVAGTLTAPSPEALADQLKRTGYLVTKARELAEGASFAARLQRAHRVSDEALVLFNVQLSTMVQVGIPLVTALDTLAQQTAHPRLRLAIGEVAKSVEGGAGFSETLAQHPAIFSPLFISMVRAGEISGKLDEILRRLAKFTKHQAALRQQVVTALTYPAFLSVIGLGLGTFLVTGIIPKFMTIFLEARVPLPLPTQLLYWASEALRRYGIGILAGMLVAGVGGQRYVRTPHGRRRFDAFLLKMPVLGDLVRQAALSRLARALETLLSSGVPVLDALAIAHDTCGNLIIADVCRRAQANVQAGGTLSESLKAAHEFPPMVIQMIAVGEVSGTVDRMFGEIAEHYDELIRHSIQRATALIEPVFLLVMGGWSRSSWRASCSRSSGWSMSFANKG